MYRAIYKNELIDAEEALLEHGKSNEYHCPHCNSKVTLCSGYTKMPYFSHHKNEACDASLYESEYNNEWHLYVQSLFPKECREIKMSLPLRKMYPEDYEINDKDGDEPITHIADICIGEYIIEIQHSPMDPEVFWERTIFYMQAGYKVIWIFDWTDKFRNNHIECYKIAYDKKNKPTFYYRVKYAPKTCGYILPQDYKANLAIYISSTPKYDDYIDETVERIVWSKPLEDQEFVSDYSRIVTRFTLGSSLEELAEHLIEKTNITKNVK